MFFASLQVRESFVKSIGSSPFTIIADETTDCATNSQLCVAVRYLDSGKVMERFLSFVEITSMTGKILQLTLKTVCCQLSESENGLQLQNILYSCPFNTRYLSTLSLKVIVRLYV